MLNILSKYNLLKIIFLILFSLKGDNYIYQQFFNSIDEKVISLENEQEYEDENDENDPEENELEELESIVYAKENLFFSYISNSLTHYFSYENLYEEKYIKFNTPPPDSKV